MPKPNKDDIKEFLKHSNWIENERSDQALEDAQRAWRYALANEDSPVIAYMLKIHELLLRKLRPDIAGKIRNCDVFIGGQQKTFISEALIRDDLQTKVVFEMLSKKKESDQRKEYRAKQVHVAFEDIHPFQDGNGRVGRILWQIHRLKLDLPIKIIHEGDEQMEYYKWFQ